MGKQPYIPFYLGDYLKDTRILPLNVRGGWVDLILYMWDNSVKGELIGTYEDFARLMTCDKQEAILVIQTLNQKKIFDYVEMGNGLMKLESRKIKRMINLSEIRQKVGKEGGNPTLLKKRLRKTKILDNQNTESEVKNEDEIELPFESNAFKDSWERWKEYRLKEQKTKFKTRDSELAQLKHLHNISFGNEQDAIKIINLSIGNCWKGLFELKTPKNGTEEIGHVPPWHQKG